jgi:trigger factor
MSVVLSISEVGPCRRELKVEVPAPAVEAETQRVLADLRRRAKVPGFRQGKVPTEILRQRYREDIHREVLDRLVPRYWRQAQAEASLDPLLAPRVRDVEVSPASTLTFVATVEVRPEIELRNIRDFELPQTAEEPTPEEIESAVDDLRRARAEWLPVERPAARGDMVEAAVIPCDAEAAPGEPQPRPARFEVGSPEVWEELSLAATGASAGQRVEFSRREEGEAGPRQRRFELRLDAVREARLPALDDAFAQGWGKESLAELRRDVEQRLRRGKAEEGRRRRERALLAQLCERHPVALPQWVVEEEVRSLLADYAEALARQGVDVERAAVDWDALAAELKPQAERQVHARLLLDAVAEREAIRVTEDDFEAAIAALARAQGRSTPAVRRELDEAGKLGSLRAQLRRQRTVRHLLGEAERGAAEVPGRESSP